MEDITMNFLSEAMSILKCENNTEMGNIISQLSQKRLAVARVHKEGAQLFGVCKFCGNNWNDGAYSLQLSGHNLKMKKHKIKCEKNPSLSIRKNFLAFYNKRKDNVLIKKCNICKAATKYGINNHCLKSKQEENASLNSSSSIVNTINTPNSIKKKRKRKSLKKSFAGISPAAVLQARLSSGLPEGQSTKSRKRKNQADTKT